jgi:hypothetical protein
MSKPATNVVPIEDRTERRKPIEHKLIRKCVDCGAAMKADNACYDMDPCPNNTTAEDAVAAYSERAYELLSEITKIPARTADGLQAQHSFVGRIANLLCQA